MEDADLAVNLILVVVPFLLGCFCMWQRCYRTRPLHLLFPKHERPTVISPIRPRERSALHFEAAEDFDPIISAGLSKHVTSRQAAARAFEVDARCTHEAQLGGSAVRRSGIPPAQFPPAQFKHVRL